MSVFVSAETLHERIQKGKKHTILAALWEFQEGKAWSKFQSEHIPTALFCEPASQLAGMPGRVDGRNPMPHIDVIDQAVEQWGIEPGRPTFVYDTGNGLFAARAWFVLRWAGIEDVHIVDGGFSAWDELGLPTVAGPGNVVVPREVATSPDNLPLAGIEQVRDFQGTLIDARSKRRFDGRREILDLRAGHIPGAINLPVSDLFEPIGDQGEVKVKSEEEIRARFAEVGLTQDSRPEDFIVYSGSGNHSALLLAAMAHAGLPVITHYVGGWSQWAADNSNPIEANV
ncbi:sulfurtransferase [Corynebacterium aquatimens]|uniref:sulfurtransferase n=1 Tax=Corynebacterium TaxID=1716 RepID=UPI001F2AC748|nr:MULTISPECIES: rhodanese-like domain-containing protein [Corynebacterium]QYH19162.1 sulfurtransferase [Corynebacterium aquatimens]UIZ91961.1 sulfurtransferase [Corynebacterium sp. CNCTC7651]